MRKALVCGLVAALAGCIVIGTPTKVPEKRPFRDQIVDFIEVGATTRDQVRAQLAQRRDDDEREPPIRGPVEYGQGEWWVYSATRAMWKWWWCLAIGGGYSADFGCDITERGEREYHLLVRFDENDVIMDYDILEDRRCGDKVCLDEGEIMVFASDTANESALLGQIPEGQCAVYLYADFPDEIAAGGMQAWLDDVPRGRIIDSKGFFRWFVQPGRHTVKTRYLFATQQVANIDCDPEAAIYLHHRVPSAKAAIVELAEVAQSKGHSAIAKRKLVADRALPSGEEGSL